jgi:NAD(P)H-dependent flavin oxidoreductase YrpB (nitropropane dioxygenase family)
VPELEKIRALGLPFWLAGSYGRPGKLAEALRLGAAGIQVGTPFAFCAESGIHPDLKRQAIARSCIGQARVFTDPVASPAGFPFKVAQMDQTLSDTTLYQERRRVCDLGYLRRLYRRPDGTVGYRCPAEPLEHFLRKGGEASQTPGRKCVCNGLAATVGVGQLRPQSGTELPLVTAGDDLACLAEFLPPGSDSYCAADVLRHLLTEPKTSSRDGARAN